MLVGFLLFLYGVLKHFCACKNLQSDEVHSTGSYCLPQKTLLLHCMKNLVWDQAFKVQLRRYV